MTIRQTVRATIDSSHGVAYARRLAAGSVVCAMAVWVVRWPRAAAWWRETERRVSAAAGAPWSPADEEAVVDRLERLALDSRAARALAALGRVPVAAWPDSRARAWMDRVCAPDASGRIRMLGTGLVTAVLTHTALMVLVSVPVGWIGWTSRAVLLMAGALMLGLPERIVVAVQERRTR